MIPLRDDNPTEITPVVTVAFIVMCVLVFLYEISLPASTNEVFVYMYGAIPAVVFGHVQLPPELMSLPAYGTLISSMFLHGGWMHLIGNMLYLWIFGNNIEDVMGHAKFIVFYGVCGVLAALSHAFIDPESTIPMVGASGATGRLLVEQEGSAAIAAGMAAKPPTEITKSVRNRPSARHAETHARSIIGIVRSRDNVPVP